MLVFGILLALKMSAEDDRTLVRGLQQKESAAMAALYDRFGRVVYSVIVAIVRDGATAEDLVQETFLRVWNRAQTFDGEHAALGPWLLAIARNRAIDHVRSAGARMGRNAFELDAHEHPSLFVDMERDLVNANHAQLIGRALGKLTEQQRRVIHLAYYEGLSQSEMAMQLGQPLGTVKSWVRGALKLLREEIGEAMAV